MISWKEACVQAGYDSSIHEPDRRYAWHAYKNGEKVYTSLISREDAEEQGKTKVVEKVLHNEAVVFAFWECRKAKEAKAQELWFNYLKDYYSHLSDSVFTACYSKAYAESHASGHDEVFYTMGEYVEFAEKIIRLHRGAPGNE